MELSFSFEVMKREYLDSKDGEQWILWLKFPPSYIANDYQRFVVTQQTFDACPKGTILLFGKRDAAGTLKAV